MEWHRFKCNSINQHLTGSQPPNTLALYHSAVAFLDVDAKQTPQRGINYIIFIESLFLLLGNERLSLSLFYSIICVWCVLILHLICLILPVPERVICELRGQHHGDVVRTSVELAAQLSWQASLKANSVYFWIDSFALIDAPLLPSIPNPNPPSTGRVVAFPLCVVSRIIGDEWSFWFLFFIVFVDDVSSFCESTILLDIKWGTCGWNFVV